MLTREQLRRDELASRRARSPTPGELAVPSRAHDKTSPLEERLLDVPSRAHDKTSPLEERLLDVVRELEEARRACRALAVRLSLLEERPEIPRRIRERKRSLA